ncbi:hypothetical protein [Thiothrix unzii]|uniref:hypothetical protein n=1 Tax=Thiothrix unzii TaxID=111769 RepID=UPI002A35EDA9|nr:hypothetical protein [Thiothrix unzii]MDX9987589.1 hypothetical protein [Thiothrix unzii]
MKNDWLSCRVVHSIGGIRLINEYEPIVKIHPHAISGKSASFNIPTYHSLFLRIEEVGLPIIGVNFYTYSDQFDGKELPEWRSHYKTSKTVWCNEDSIQIWSNIGTSAHNSKNGKLWDLGSRISQQLRICSWRLKELSESYHSQLISVAGNAEFGEEQRFMNGFTWLCYINIQSFLVDVCILRDYLSEYAASFVFHAEIDDTSPNITAISGLIKHVLKKKTLDDPLFSELNQITSDNGWLRKLGAYRDLVVHSAPLARAEKKLFAIRKTIKIPGGEIPSICCPMPKNPKEISASRANGSMFADFDEQFSKYVGIGDKCDEHIDGLEYCHQILGQISDLSYKLALKSPVEPKIMVFDHTNIIGDVKITYR